MLKVWDGTTWKRKDNISLYVYDGTEWTQDYALRVRAGSSWLPASVSYLDTSATLIYTVEAPTPPAPPVTTAIMPDLNGKTYLQAVAALDAVELAYTTTITTTNTLSLDDYVVNNSQNPAAGSTVSLTATVSFSYYNYTTAQVSVPNLNGYTKTGARALLTQNSLGYLETEVETTNNSLVNLVVNNSQSPAAGTIVPENTDVSYSYYIPSTTTTVPQLNNLTRTQAQALLQAAELSGSESTLETTNASLVGTIVTNSQYPAAGETVGKNTYVSYQYYILDTATVPNVVNLTYTQADAAIYNAGLNPSSTFTYTTNASLYDKVYAQTQTAGSTVVAGTTVNFQYYLAQPMTTVPNLVGLSRTQAQTALANVGLSYAETAGVVGTVDQVYSQSPSSGSSVSPGSTISYTYYTAYVPQWVTKTGTYTLRPQWVGSYNADNTRRTDTTSLYHGYFDATRGRQKSQVGYDFSFFNGKTNWQITSATLNWYQIHTWLSGSGGRVEIGSHSNTSRPSTYSGVIRTAAVGRGVVRNNSYTLNLGSSIIGDLNGSGWGLVFTAEDSTNANYGYIEGTVNSTPYITGSYTYQVYE